VNSSQRIALFLAQGFGLGRIPFAPGTFGSVLGVLWFGLLLSIGSLWGLIAGAIAGFACSVWLCGVGERLLGRKDPGSVVMDEITAMPVCFFALVPIHFWQTGGLPPTDYFFSNQNWLRTAGVFAAFRFFDVIKPWPVRQSQSLPGGWGITVDDFLAAVYVNGVVLVIHAVNSLR
jgi:phosphatidylglycerophosphatase A